MVEAPITFEFGSVDKHRTERETLKLRATAERQALSDKITESHVNEAVDTANAFAATADMPGSVRSEMEDILGNSLYTRSIVAPTTEEKSESKYMTSRRVKLPNGEYGYKNVLEPNKILADQQRLARLAEAYPNKAVAFRTMSNHLDVYARRQAPAAQAAYKREIARQNTFAANAFKHMGRMTGGILLGAMAAVTGITMLLNMRKNKSMDGLSAAPFLYIGAAALLASPTLRRQMFGTKAENTLEDASLVLNNQRYKNMARQYHIGGKEWQELVQSSMGSNAERSALLRKVGKGTATKEEITTFVEGSTTDPRMQQTLRAMIARGDYATFIDIMGKAKSKDSQQIVLDYVGAGADRYARDMGAIKGA